MPALWHDMWFLARQSEAEAQGLEANRALVLIFCSVVARYDWQGSGDHGGVRMKRSVVCGVVVGLELCLGLP